MNIDQVKKVAIIFLACTAGAVVLQVAFPILLGALVSGLPFVGIFLIYDLLIRKKLQIRFEWGSDAGETLQTGSKEPESFQPETDSEKSEPKKEPASAKQEGQDQSANEANESFTEEKRRQVYQWYQERGQERLRSIIETQYAKGLYECWIRKDGICNVRTEKGYRRAGILPGYPGECVDLVAEVMRQDGLNAVIQKRYLYLSWAEE